MVRIPRARLADLGAQLLRAKGLDEPTARYLADVAVATEAFGIHTHGLVLLPHWDREVGKSIDPAARPRVAKDKGATALIDGNRSFGQLALKLARELAAQKARAHGVAMVAATNMSWLGALGPQILPLSQAGFFAQLWAQTNSCKDCAPWGGIDAKFSTNPVALTFPTGARPMVSDFSTAALSIGRTRALARKGETAPENLFLDKDGRPSRDPNAMLDGGSLFFTGGERYGYRGYALSLWAEALTAMAGGSANNPDVPSAQSFSLTVIDPEAFAGPDYYQAEIQRFLAHIKSSRLRPGFDAILVPGERAQAAAARAETDGVPVEARLLALLNEVAERNGLPTLAPPHGRQHPA